MKKHYQSGLTLIELLSVLVILTAIAGTLTPLIPDTHMIAHSAAGADSIKETAKAIMLFRHINKGSYPDRLDSMIDDSDNIIFNIQNYAYISTLDDGDQFRVRIREALLDAGINELMIHDSNSEDITFGDYHGAYDLNSLGTQVITLRNEGIEALSLEALSLHGINAYIALGIGKENSAIGRTMIDAPVRFHQDGQSPKEAYSRWLAIFAVPADGPLRLVSVTGDDEDLNEHLKRYYNAKN